MLRNREIQILILIMGIISLLGGIAVSFFSPIASGITFMTAGILIGCCLFFTRWRYREIERLSMFLRKISSGDYTLDVRDNYEGELSILKNDIYKVTTMLAEHHKKTQQDKVQLTEAISDISHQLKTPLTSMMMMADLLQSEQLPTNKRIEFAHHIQTQLERIEWLVSSLLKLSKIDAGTVQFKKDRVLVKELIQKALDPLLIPMEIKEQTLVVDGDANVYFIGDINWTSEALINLLKNAVEHTAQGGEISIIYSENALFTEIIIADNGKGIPKEDLPYLFQRFYKGKQASEESVGIGLAMAQSIITNQDGDIEVQSKQGKGTRFSVKFYKQVV